MSKESSIKVKVKIDPDSMKLIESFAKAAKDAHDLALKLAGAGLMTTDQEPEIRIIEPGALPAGLYMRDSVLAAVHAEIVKDYKATGQVAPGAELIGQEEASDGETEKVHKAENDSAQRGAGSEPSQDSGDNGSPAGRGGEDHNRQPDENPGESESTDQAKDSGEKPSGE